MRYVGGRAVAYGRRDLGVYVAALAAFVLFLAALFAVPAMAQDEPVSNEETTQAEETPQTEEENNADLQEAPSEEEQKVDTRAADDQIQAQLMGEPAAPSGPLAGAEVEVREDDDDDNTVNEDDVLIIDDRDYEASRGASVTIEDKDGTQGTFVDGRNARITITADGALRIEVTDDPIGLNGGGNGGSVDRLDTIGDDDEGLEAVTSTGVRRAEAQEQNPPAQNPIEPEDESSPETGTGTETETGTGTAVTAETADAAGTDDAATDDATAEAATADATEDSAEEVCASSERVRIRSVLVQGAFPYLDDFSYQYQYNGYQYGAQYQDISFEDFEYLEEDFDSQFIIDCVGRRGSGVLDTIALDKLPDTGGLPVAPFAGLALVGVGLLVARGLRERP